MANAQRQKVMVSGKEAMEIVDPRIHTLVNKSQTPFGRALDHFAGKVIANSEKAKEENTNFGSYLRSRGNDSNIEKRSLDEVLHALIWPGRGIIFEYDESNPDTFKTTFNNGDRRLTVKRDQPPGSEISDSQVESLLKSTGAVPQDEIEATKKLVQAARSKGIYSLSVLLPAHLIDLVLNEVAGTLTSENYFFYAPPGRGWGKNVTQALSELRFFKSSKSRGQEAMSGRVDSAVKSLVSSYNGVSDPTTATLIRRLGEDVLALKKETQVGAFEDDGDVTVAIFTDGDRSESSENQASRFGIGHSALNDQWALLLSKKGKLYRSAVFTSSDEAGPGLHPPTNTNVVSQWRQPHKISRDQQTLLDYPDDDENLRSMGIESGIHFSNRFYHNATDKVPHHEAIYHLGDRGVHLKLVRQFDH